MNNNTKTISGLIWRFFERCGAEAVSFVVSIILGRILEPEMYGTVALVAVFTTILQVFVDSGLGNALIQKKKADDLDFSTVFYFNIGMCSFLYLCTFLAAPLLSKFFCDDLSLVAIIRVLSLTLVVSGIRNVQQAYVSRKLLFKKFFFVTLGGTISAAIVGILMAHYGFGVWALVAQQLVNVTVSTIILWFTVKWRPRLAFSFSRLKELFSYGWKLLVSALLDTGYNELRQLIIGKKYSDSDLAFYNRGRQMPYMLVTNINTAINSVLLPTMSKEQDNAERVKSMTRRAIRVSTYIMAPMMVGLAVCAEPLIRLLLTDKWLDSVLFLRIFCVSFLFYPIHTSNLNAIKAMGRSDLFLKLEIIKKIVGIILILATMFISVEAMAYSLLANTLFSTIINSFPNNKLLHYSWFEQMKDILPTIGLALLMGTPVLLLQYLPLPTIVILIMQVAAGVALYWGLSVLFKFETFTYMLNTVKEFTKKKKKAE